MASIVWTDADGTWKLMNGIPYPADRFANWVPDSQPIGDRAHRQSDGAMTMLRLRTDFGASFEFPYIALKKLTNQLIRAQEIGNAAWNKSNVTVGTDVIVAPDGSQSADQITATASAATNINQTFTATGTVGTYTIYARKGSGGGGGYTNSFGVRNNTTATNLVFVSINLDTGVVTPVIGSGAYSLRDSSSAGGWWRLVMPVSSGISAGNTIGAYAGFDGAVYTAGDNLYVWGGNFTPNVAATPDPLLTTFGTALTSVSKVDLADRLRQHLLNGGQCSVYPNDSDSIQAWTTLGLKPGTVPTLTLTDRRTMEFTLGLSLIDQAGSPSRLIPRYGDGV